MLPPLLLALSLLATPALAGEWPDLQTTPLGPVQGSQDAAVLVAIEDYPFVEHVLGAGANADAWMGWFKNGRGIPLARVQVLRDRDANARRIREALATAAREVGPGGTLWFVFIGHGAPSKDGADGLLVGANADRSANGIYDESVPRAEVVRILAASPATRAVAVLDACFSGQSGSGQALVAGLQPLIPTALLGEAPDKVTVLTAAGSGEFSGPLAGTARPAFSYLALGALRGWADADGGNGDGVVSAAEVLYWTMGALRATVRGRTQTPMMIGEDAALAAVVDRVAPDVLAIGRPAGGWGPQREPKPIDDGISTLPPGDRIAKLMAEAEEAERKRLAAEADAKQKSEEAAAAGARAAAEAKARAAAAAAQKAKLEADRAAARRAELDRMAGEARAQAAADFQVLAPVLAGEVSAAMRPVLEAYVQQYGDVKVRFDGVEESVVFPEVGKVSAALGPRVVTGKLGYAMVRVPAGTYTIGSPGSEEGRYDREAQHDVTLTRSYLIGRTEVTQGLWKRVIGSNPSSFTACGAECPVEQVSWCDALVFANKLSASEGLAAAYTLPAGFVVGLAYERCNALAPAVRWNARASGYRLPTEAEWEIAARAGEDGPYAGGELDEVGWYDGNSGGTTHPVGRKQANAGGLYDMTGNVWEWAWDVYEDYGGSVTDPLGAASGPLRVFRGGSLYDTAGDARAASRSWYRPGRRRDRLGLRLSRTIP